MGENTGDREGWWLSGSHRSVVRVLAVQVSGSIYSDCFLLSSHWSGVRGVVLPALRSIQLRESA